MPVIEQPSIWQYIGEGLGGGAKTYYGAKEQQEADAQRQAQFLLQMVNSGAMDADTANQSPTAAKYGMKFQPSQTEMRRKIAQAPTPTAPLPGAMQGAPFGASAQIPTGPAGSQFSDVAHQAAGLPTPGETASQNAQSDLQGKLAGLKARYIGGDVASMTPEQLGAIGQKTPAEKSTEERAKLDPVYQAAANRYVGGMFDQAVASMKIDPNTAAGMSALRRQSPTIAAGAYAKFLEESKASGSIVDQSEQGKAYAKSFFDAAVSNKLQEMESERQKLALANRPQRDTEVGWYNAIMRQADEIDKQVDGIRKSPTGMAATTMKPEDIAKNPAMQATLQQLSDLHARRAVYEQTASEIVSGHTSPDNAKSVLSQRLQALDAKRPPATPAPTAGKADVEGMAAVLKANPSTLPQLQALVKTGKLSQADYDAVVALSKKP